MEDLSYCFDSRGYSAWRQASKPPFMAYTCDLSAGQVFNTCTGTETSINNLIREIEQVIGKRALVNNEPWQPGDIYHEYGDTTLSREILGGAPVTPLADGIRELVRYFKSEVVK